MTQNRFQFLFYALVSIGILSVGYTNTIHPVVLGLAAVSLFIGWHLDRTQRIVLPVTWAKPVFALLMGYVVFEVIVLGIGWFYAVLDLLVLVTAVKVISPKANRDYAQLFAVGFLLMLATSILTTDAMFSVFFVSYILLLSWTLMVFTTKVVLERDEDPVRSAVAEHQAHMPTLEAQYLLANNRFGNATFVIVFVLLFTVVFFLFFPRFGAGIIGGSLGQNRQSGMSDEIRFDAMGELKPDRAIAVRLVLEQGELQTPAFLRGNTLDNYKDHVWSSSLQSVVVHNSGDSFVLFPHAHTEFEIQYRLLADDLGVQMMPLLVGTNKLSTSLKFLTTRNDGTLRRSNRFQGAFGFDAWASPAKYRTLSTLNLQDQFNNHVVGRWPHPKTLPYFLQLDLSALNASRLFLEQNQFPLIQIRPDSEFSSDAQVLQYAKKLQDYLRSNYRYVLTDRDERDPLVQFLQDGAGHCELFATVFAVALRYQGIPTRIVSGFYGGEESEYGDYYIFRNSDAHSWVEIWTETYGWIAADPTAPYEGDRFNIITAAIDTFNELSDLYKLWWINRVITYDMGNQMDAIDSFTKDLKGLGQRQNKSAAWFSKINPKTRNTVFAMLAVLAVLGSWFFFRPRQANAASGILTYSRSPLRDQIQLLRIQMKYGKRMRHQSWSEYIAESSMNKPLSQPDEQWLENYIASRYSTSS